MNNKFDSVASTWDLNPTSQKLTTAIALELDKEFTWNTTWNILEYGAGTGSLLLHLLPKVSYITAMDNSQGMLDVLQQKLTDESIHNVTLQKHDINCEELPFQQFDCIVSAMTLHHISDTVDFFTKCYNALKPNGRIIIIDLVTEDGTFHREYDASVKHLGFDCKNIEKIMNEVGFTGVSFHAFYSIYKEHVDAEFPVFLISGHV